MPKKIESRPPPQVRSAASVVAPAPEAAPAAAKPVGSLWSPQAAHATTERPSGSLPPSTSAAALWGAPDAKVAQLRAAMQTQPEAALSKTLAAAAKESPKAFRAALRDQLEVELKDASKLQRHLTLLDLDGDGEVSMKENYKSLRQLGMSPAKAVLVGGASQLALIFSTRDSVGVSIPIKNADRGMHKTVDTGAMDKDLALTKKLDEMMAEDANGDGFLDMNELGHLLDKRAEASSANKIAKALVKAANKAEFAALFELVGGKMSRDDLQDFYMGSLFFSLLPADALAQRLVLLREN